MNTISVISGLMFTAAITPGPNNLMVLNLAAQRNLRSVLMAISGIVAGGLAMFALAQLGIAYFVSRHAWVRDGIVDCGALYLLALGLILVVRSRHSVSVAANHAKEPPMRPMALLVFQFLNPKAWVLVLSASAAASGTGGFGRQSIGVTLMLIFAAVSTACLLAWAALGRMAARFLQHGALRVLFDCVLGLSLVACAGSLLATQRAS